VGLFFTQSRLGWNFISKQKCSLAVVLVVWPPAASAISSCDGSAGASEAKTVAVEESSRTTVWRSTPAILRSLVGWASLAASSWSSDFQIWVACFWHTVLTARAVGHHGGPWWAGAHSSDPSLARKASCWLGVSALTTCAVRNCCFPESADTSTILISLDAVAARLHCCNASCSCRDHGLSWWASALVGCWICVLAWKAARSLDLASCTRGCLHQTCWACADATLEGLSRETSWTC
jgi:hypothetical protein